MSYTEQTRILIKRAQEGEREAREQLFRENTGLIYSVIKRFAGRGAEMDDLFQIGSIGLLKAIDHFNLSFDVRFSTYAVPMIIGEIKRFLRDDGIIKISRSLKENHNKIQKIRVEMYEKLGREATMLEICEEMQMNMEELMLSWEADNVAESLHKTIYQGDGTEISLLDKLQEEENQQEQVLNRIFLEEILDSLSLEERKVIDMRYYEEKTQSQIAEILGISQVQVSRMEKRILKKMRETAGGNLSSIF